MLTGVDNVAPLLHRVWSFGTNTNLHCSVITRVDKLLVYMGLMCKLS